MLSDIEPLSQCRIPLTVSNDIPGSEIRLGYNDDEEA